MLPKPVVNVMDCELMRAARLTNKEVQYISFKVPNRDGSFKEEIYPDWRIGTPTMTFDEYAAKNDKDPAREKVEPSGHHAA